MVAENFVYEIPRRGFFVTPMSVEELRQLYAIRKILDPGALRLAGIPSDKHIDELDRLNEKIAAAEKAAKEKADADAAAALATAASPAAARRGKIP